MLRVLLASLLTAVVVLPALAQDNRRVERTERVAANMYGPIGAQIASPGLPGVGLDATKQTDRPSGPGGMANGVGAVGTLMPNSSSSNGQLLNNEDTGYGIPLRFGAPRRALAN